MSTMTEREVVQAIHRAGGRIFEITFIKRTTGELRVMKCRTGVKKFLAGGEPAYNFKEHHLVPVFDMQKMAYRSIPVEGILEIKIDGQPFEVVHTAQW